MKFLSCFAGLIKKKDALIVVEISSQWTLLRKQLRSQYLRVFISPTLLIRFDSTD